MSKQFIQMTSGWIPVSVMVLLAIAVIAGQARANLAHETRVSPLGASTAIRLSLDAEALRKFELLPAAVESLLTWPRDLTLYIDDPARPKKAASDAVIRRGPQ